MRIALTLGLCLAARAAPAQDALPFVVQAILEAICKMTGD